MDSTIFLSMNRIFSFIILIFSLITLHYLIFLSTRVDGKISKSTKFLGVAMLVLIIQSIFTILNLFSAIFLETFTSIIQILVVLFILLSVLSLKSKVDEIDGNHMSQRLKKRK